MPFKIVGVEDPEGKYRIANVVYVTSQFFATLGIPLLRGRGLQTADGAEAPSVLVANQAFVEANLDGGAGIGARLTFGGREWEIVGISGDVQQSSAGWGSSQPIWKSPTLYIPAAQAGDGFFRGIHIWFSPSWLVKTSGSPTGLAAAITHAIHNVDPDMPVARVAILSDVMSQALARSRFEAMFLLIVAAFALLLAAVGLYGIVANEVVERTPELGLRMALGSTPGQAIFTVGTPGLRLTLLGLMVGAILTAFAAPWIARLTWGIVPYDPITTLVVALLLAVLAATASYLPARRVARLEPSRILRDE
jgi:predicted lysophospholipase L1 biosynthesis ABC-type transport system permease subunit